MVRSTKVELMSKMEFLIHPTKGMVQRLLNLSTTSFALKRALLSFVFKLLQLRDLESPFFQDTYIDSYIGFHYQNFLRSYHSYSFDSETLVLCRKHLKILISFASQKNEKIKQKFYQLRVMDWLNREINLEYEVKILRKNYEESLLQEKEEQEKETQKKCGSS